MVIGCQPFFLQEQHSESYTDLTNLGTHRDNELNSDLSRSLQNIVDVPSQQSNRESEKDKSKHRFERISYQKHLSNRTREKSTLERQGTKRQNTMVKENSVLTEVESKKAAINILQKDSLEQIQKRIGNQNGNINGTKQYVYVKDLRKDNSVHIYQNSLSSITTASTVKRKSQENGSHDRPESKSELPLLEQSGMYQLDLSNLRNEIPPVHHDPLTHIGSAHTERGYRRRNSGKQSRKGSSGRRRLLPQVPQAKEVEKKWRDGCDCLRCNMMRQQYAEGDEGYKNWGNYPCINVSKSKLRRDMYAYDTD